MHGFDKALILLNDNSEVKKLSKMFESVSLEALFPKDHIELFTKLINEQVSVLIVDVDIVSENVFSIEKYSIINPYVLIICIGSDADQTIEYLNHGADRFINKPINNELIVANLKSLLRRKAIQSNKFKTTAGSSNLWKLDITSWKLITPDNKLIPLTGREFRFLEKLISSPGKVVAKQELIDLVIGKNYNNSSHRLNLMIARLRKKVASNCSSELPLKTEYTAGYSFTSPAIIS